MSATRSRQAIRTAVLVAAAALTPAPAWAQGHLAPTELQVGATVRPSVMLRFDQRSVSVKVTAADIRRGYVDLPEDAMLSVDAGSVKPRLVVDFSPNGSAFSSVDLVTKDMRTGAERVRALHWLEDLRGAQAGASLQEALRLTASEHTGTMMLISYRFRLAPGVRPGTYPLPMSVDIGL